MLIACHGVLIPIGMDRRHDAMTDILERDLSPLLRRIRFQAEKRHRTLGISTAYATNPGTMAKPYYPSFLQHPDGRSFNLLIEAKTSPARRRSPEEFAAAALVHVLDALIDHSIKHDLPYEALLRSRDRRTADPSEFFFWGKRLRERVDEAIAKHQAQVTQSRRPGTRKSR